MLSISTIKLNNNSIYSLMNQALMATFGMLFLFLLLRMMPKHEVGRWMIFISAISISDMALQGLLQTIVIKKTVEFANDNEKMEILHTNTLGISIVLIAIISLTFLISIKISSLLNHHISILDDIGLWYPLFGFSMLLHNLSLWFNMGKEKYQFLFIQRLTFCFIAIGFLLIHYWHYHSLSFNIAVRAQLVAYLSSSIYSFMFNRFNFKLTSVNRSMIFNLLGYGKYTIGTLIGSSLLRNADTFMIGIFMNSGYVAIYSLAQKVMEIFEILLRSVASHSFSTLVRTRNNLPTFAKFLQTRITFLTILFIPLTLLIFIYAHKLISFISHSDQYVYSAEIVKVFMIYVILLPADRLIGVALEAMNRPVSNLYKMIFIIATNLMGNFISIKYFHSLIGVAFVSSLALFTGILSGYYFLCKESFPLLSFSKLTMRINQAKSIRK